MAKTSKSKPKASGAPTPPAPKYEERLILFLDFLGFKEMVTRTVAEPSFLPKLVAAMDIVGRIGEEDAKLFKSQQITQFSDCIVVSYDVNERSVVFWLLVEIALAVVHLAESGFLVRGGLTVGDLFHTERHVVGPAMVEAYRLESEVAKVPRVVIDDNVLAVARQSHSRHHSPKQEEGHVRAFMTKDDDGVHYFDYVSWKSVVEVTGGNNDGYAVYLQRIGEMVKAGLSHEDPRVQDKYLWLHRQYLAAVDLVRGLPPGHGYRCENPALCQAIESLRRYEDLADAAAAKAVPAFKSKKA